MEEASRFGIMNVDENDLVYEFEEKPARPKSNLASMGIYVFTWSKPRDYLIADEADPTSPTTSAKTSSPPCWTPGEVMSAYRFSGYRKDVGTIQSSGTPTWTCSPSPAASVPLTPPGPSYAKTPTKPPTHRP